MPRGNCFCGKVGFEWNTPSLWSAHCHCTMCQRAHGAAFVTWIGTNAADVTLEGEEDIAWFASSPEAERGFCRHCGSTLFFRSERWPGELHIARANVEGETDISPSIHTYWPAHVEWFPFSDDLPHHDGVS